MDENYHALRDNLVSRRKADPDGEIGAERMDQGFDVAEAMADENSGAPWREGRISNRAAVGAAA